ncbi:CpsD/CapB family tyrosine-protein kinase [Desulfococcaceae bacterium HSG9]|nr:CpsD/CapB family tyrosine-protein kinase [Desulfococcaceae bacterium HSG9]
MSAEHTKNKRPEKSPKQSSSWKAKLKGIKLKGKKKPSDPDMTVAPSGVTTDVSSDDLFKSIPKAIDFDPFEGIDLNASPPHTPKRKQVIKRQSDAYPDKLTNAKTQKHQARRKRLKKRKTDNPPKDVANVKPQVHFDPLKGIGRMDSVIPDVNDRKTATKSNKTLSGLHADFDPLKGIDSKPSAIAAAEMRPKSDNLLEDIDMSGLSVKSPKNWELTPSEDVPSENRLVKINDPTSNDWWPKAFDYVEVHRLKEKLLAEMQKDNQNIVMVTSPHDHSGCTFLAFMLGFSAASFSEIRVLLADLNMRNPELHRPFGLQLENGFTEVSSGSLYWKDAIKNTSFGSLKILTAGSQDIQLSFALKHSKTREMLVEMKDEYDLIIFDTSPVLVHNRQNIDPAFLGLISDIVIVVVQDKITKKSELVATVDTIKNSGGKIHGIVYNQQFKAKSIPRLLCRFLKI